MLLLLLAMVVYGEAMEMPPWEAPSAALQLLRLESC